MEVLATELILLASEYGRVASSTSSLRLDCRTGTVGVGDFFNKGLKEKSIKLKSGIGICLVSIYALRSGKIILVLTKNSENKAQNNVNDFPDLIL